MLFVSVWGCAPFLCNCSTTARVMACISCSFTSMAHLLKFSCIYSVRDRLDLLPAFSGYTVTRSRSHIVVGGIDSGHYLEMIVQDRRGLHIIPDHSLFQHVQDILRKLCISAVSQRPH